MSETRQQLVEDLKTLLEQDVMDVKDQVEQIKTRFYRIESEELEEPFKELLAEYKAKRAELAAKVAKEQEENLARKQAILAEMKTLAESETDGVMSNLQKMRDLQAVWKTIGDVPAEKNTEIRKAYQQYQEQFYDLVKINIELRDLDFKKNLEMKTLLCEAAERLQSNENIVEASRALQQLHDEWAEIGPVARELREDLWNRFKEASTVINKKHQAYFDELHAKEHDNLARKQAIIDQLKAINAEVAAQSSVNSKGWEQATERVQALQNEWRTIGYAPKKSNQSIYEEYRAECDAFFTAKTAYFKGLRDTLDGNLKRKRSLVEQAQNIAQQATNDAENIRWNETADKLRELQAEWKTVGTVARKYSDDLWKQFTAACDTFFNAKREAVQAERANRQQRKETVAAKFSKRLENLNDDQKLYRMRDTLKQEILTAENNILFFTAKSKTANKLVSDMQRKIDDLKAQLDEVQQKIKALKEE